MNDFDVIVIGAGAAGLFAATAAAERGKRTLLLEKNRRPGVKILASGGTKCNVTSTLPIARLGALFGQRAERFLRHGLHAMTPADVRRILEQDGVATQELPFEKVFPASGKASDVLDAFLARAERARVSIATSEPVAAVERDDRGLTVKTPERELRAGRVIVTAGGRSYPKTGTIGEGYSWLERLGHTITPTRPALVPLRVDLEWVGKLAGIAVEDANVAAVDPRGKVLLERRRPVLFTHRGLSGPGPMDVSRFMNAGSGARLLIDWMPHLKLSAVEAALANPARGSFLVMTEIPGDLPRRLVWGLMAHAGVPSGRTLAQLRRDERMRLIDVLKRCHVPVAGDEGFDKAEVTAGGVALDEVEPRTMESRRVPGLHIAGEILDVDGPIGGFNFQAAFATGHVAGLAAGGAE
jgi:predicted Rossmann fold flavoprotein